MIHVDPKIINPDELKERVYKTINDKSVSELPFINKSNCTKLDGHKNNKTESDIDAFVHRLYREVLGRAPDVAGLDYYCKRLLSKKMTPAAVGKAIVFSKEFLNIMCDNAEFVRRLYRGLLARDPEEQGLYHYTVSLDAGCTRKKVFQKIIRSEEFYVICKSLKVE